MPSLVDLIESHLLRNLTDPDTYDAGIDLADRRAVEFDELGPLHARARVEDGQAFVVDLKSGPGILIWSCSEPGGSRGALCRHCVAAAVDTWRRAPAHPANTGSSQDGDASQPLRFVQAALAGQAATPITAPRPTALAMPFDVAKPVEGEAPLTSEPAPTTPAEPAPVAGSDGQPPALLGQPAQPASPVLVRSRVPQPAPHPAAAAMPRPVPLISARPEPEAVGITGVHAVVFTPAVAQVRAFFRDVLGLPNVDAGDGWLIFALPPAELAVHPADLPSQEIYLMCDDIEATLGSLERKGTEVRRPVREQEWGFVTEIVIPGGTGLAIYQPKHPSPRALPREPGT